MKLTNLLAGAGLAAICSGSLASAAVLYDNGPVNGTIAGWEINGGQAIGDSFTLTSASTVTGVTFGVWAPTGDKMSSVDWGITSDPTAVPDNGTAAVTSGPVITNTGGYDVSVDSFSTGSVALAAGTYYLWLQNASNDNGDSLYWDINNGASTANWAFGGAFQGSLADDLVTGTNSDSFQILGPAGGVPEPATWAMMLVGFGGIGAAMRARRKAAVLAA